jgi:hypothetical protein
VVERSERYASEAKPEEPRDTKRRARAGLLAAVLCVSIINCTPNAWRARRGHGIL